MLCRSLLCLFLHFIITTTQQFKSFFHWFSDEQITLKEVRQLLKDFKPSYGITVTQAKKLSAHPVFCDLFQQLEIFVLGAL